MTAACRLVLLSCVSHTKVLCTGAGVAAADFGEYFCMLTTMARGTVDEKLRLMYRALVACSPAAPSILTDEAFGIFIHAVRVRTPNSLGSHGSFVLRAVLLPR